MFWDSQIVLLAHFQKRGENVNSAPYCEVLLKHGDAIHRKRPSQLARVALRHHDNARPHTARAIQQRIQELLWELLDIRLTAPTWPLVTSICLVRYETTLVANCSLTKRFKRR
jgi:ribosomal protein L34E